MKKMKRINFIKDIKLMVVIYEPALTSDTFLVTCNKQKNENVTKEEEKYPCFLY
jgi:hypothetical protein